MRRALITGITGQDGSYLAELLLEKGYEVWGTVRRKSTADYGNAEHLRNKVKFIYADMTDMASLENALSTSKADEVYNLAAQSFVAASWLQPTATSEINGIGVLNLLQSIKRINSEIKFYQASTSELFGLVRETPQCETTPFYPRSPYGVSKLFAHWMTVNYRESYDLFACCGILFNHESERRGYEFVTRKISRAVAKISLGCNEPLEIGSLDAKRDWGHAIDYVYAMYLILAQDKPDDYVIASGETRSVRDFVTVAFRCVGTDVEWQGSGVNETGIDRISGKTIVRVNPEFFRPAEVELLLGCPEKAERVLGWKRTISFEQLVSRMVENDLNILGKA